MSSAPAGMSTTARRGRRCHSGWTSSARAEEQRKQYDAARQQARQAQEDRMNYERARKAAAREAAELRRIQIERYGR